MNQPLFRHQAVEHQRERLWGDVILTQPLSLTLVTIIISLVLAALVTYLVTGTYTRKETVRGYLVPETGLVHVQPSDPGSAQKIHVHPGDKVKKGDPLVDVRTDRTLNNGNDMSGLLIDLLKQQKSIAKSRIKRERSREQRRRAHLNQRVTNSRSQIRQLKKQERLQQERLSLARDRYKALDGLKADQLIAESDYQEQYQRFLDERQTLQELEKRLITEQSNLQSALFERRALTPKIDEEIDRLQSEIRRLDQQIIRRQGERSYTIEAPINGRVTSLQISQGQTITPQRPILAVLPEDEDLEARLLVPTRAVGFIRPEQKVEMRFDAFPYERFGVHDGRVQRISKTVLSPRDVSAPLRIDEPVYRATAEVSKQLIRAYGRYFPLQSGMTFEANILLDERPLYQWILKPLYSLQGTL